MPVATAHADLPQAFGIPPEMCCITANGALNVPVVFGLSGTSTGVSISVLATFPVTLTVDFGNGNTYTATTSIIVPVGAGIL